MKILLTSTSFQDTPGKHQELLNKQGFIVDTLRGPIQEKELLPDIENAKDGHEHKECNYFTKNNLPNPIGSQLEELILRII